MIVFKIVILCIALLCMPYIMGGIFADLIGLTRCNSIKIFLGWMVVFAIAEILIVPLTLLKCSFDVFCIIYGSLILITIIIYSIMMFRRKEKHIFLFDKKFIFLKCVCVGLILLQIVIVVVMRHSDADDVTFIGNAITSLETNTLYQFDPTTGEYLSELPLRTALSGISMVWAFMSRISNLHVTIIVYSIIPIYLISCAYIVWWNLGKELLVDEKSWWLFLVFISVLNIFGNNTVFTTASFLLFRIWQGKAILANIIIPGVWFFSLKFWKKEYNARISLFVMMLLSTAACCVSSMSVPLIPVLIMGMASICALTEKRIAYLFLGIMSCIPCAFIGVLYIIMRG